MSLSQYLNRYSEPEARADFSHLGVFKQVLIIPAYDEPVTLADKLKQLLTLHSQLLIIIVINQPTNQTDTTNNQQLWAALIRDLNQQLPLYTLGESALWPIDRFSSNAITSQHGVGLARKIGADIAAALFLQQRLSSPWLHMSDADTYLPDDYFSASAAEPEHYSALIYPFKHKPAANNNLAMQLYEFRLRYYAAALAWAGSPYAFISIGSIIAVHVNHYAKVRGVPKRPAGEDFHLLNKLAKCAPIKTLSDVGDIIIDERDSQRVPFGTAVAVQQINATGAPLSQALFENPLSFERLRQLLADFTKLYALESSAAAVTTLARSPALAYALNAINITKALDHAFAQARNEQQFCKHLHTFFDGLQTLRFLHCLRDYDSPDLSFNALEPKFITHINLNEVAKNLFNTSATLELAALYG